MTNAWALLLTVMSAPNAKLAIVDLDAPGMMLGLSTQVSRALLEEAGRQQRPVITPEELRATLGSKNYQELVKCGAGKIACVAQQLGPVPGVTHAVVGSLNRDEKNYLLKLFLIDLKNLQVVADVERPILIASRRFQHEVEEAVPRFLRGEREAKGKLLVTCNVKDAQVSINGEFRGATPFETELKPGKYEVTLERNKYLPVTRLVAVEANQKTEELIRLILKPGERPDELEVPPLVAQQHQSEPFHLSAGSWVSAGATVAALGAATYFGLTASAGDQKVRGSYDAARGVYGVPRQDALKVQRDAMAANIAFAVAGAAAVATGIFVFFDARGASATVAPVVGPTGAGMVFSGSF